MKIKRTSWHYKIRNFRRAEKSSDNLCNYFWSLVGNLFLGFAVMMIPVIFIGLLCTSSEFAIALSICLYLAANILLPVFAIAFFRNKFGLNTEAPGENIVKEFIKAKKNKLCPMIDYE